MSNLGVLMLGGGETESTYRDWSPTRLPIDEGMVPVSWLPLKLLERRGIFLSEKKSLKVS